MLAMSAKQGFPGPAFASEDSLPTMVAGGRRPVSGQGIFPDPDDVHSMGSMRTARTMRGGGADSSGEPLLGRVDQYDIVRKLGGGGFGVVYLARDAVSRTDVALKTLHPLLKHNAEEMDLLREKFALAARLSHPNIATALVLHPCERIDIFDETARRELRLSIGDSLMVMRYAPGVTLSRWRRQFPGGVVPPHCALEVARQVAAALDYAHSERIVHRDVKPANVMVETLAAEPHRGGGLQTAASAPPSIRVRLLDFGLAAEIRSSMSRVSAEAGDTSGTRPYMAPEQWLGRKQDGRTDQYALACVLYELLSGSPPFAGVFETGDPVIMRAAVVSDQPEEIGSVSPAANDALLRALAKDPNDRFPSCAAFVEALVSTAKPAFTAERAERTEYTERTEGSTSSSGWPRSVRQPTPPASEPKVEAGSDSPGGSGNAETPDKPGSFKAGCFVIAALAALAVGAWFYNESENAPSSQPPPGRTSVPAPRPAPSPKRTEEPKPASSPKSRPTAPVVQARALRSVTLPDGSSMDLRGCPAGSFTMGSPTWEEGRSDDEVQHRVEISKGFWLGETEVTQGQWKAVMDGETVIDLARKALQDDTKYNFGGTEKTLRDFWGVSRDSDPANRCADIDDDAPVYYVNWNEASRFCERLNERERAAGRLPDGYEYRLPTEAEWEYACRAGTTTSLPNGKEISIRGANNAPTLDDIAWYGGNSSVGFSGRGWDTDGWQEKQYPGGTAAPRHVGTKAPNAWGLYDMIGNVWEWCLDWYAAYPSGAATDPTGPVGGVRRVSRGGSWSNGPRGCRSAYRDGSEPGYRVDSLGFRVALAPVLER